MFHYHLYVHQRERETRRLITCDQECIIRKGVLSSESQERAPRDQMAMTLVQSRVMVGTGKEQN